MKPSALPAAQRTMVIAGGSGFLGRAVSGFLSKRGWRIRVLSRQHRADIPGATTRIWDGRSAGEWINEIDGADCLLNLAGRSVNCRYNAGNRMEIEQSR